MNKKYQKLTEILAMNGVEATKITRDMRIVHDLSINGDDADLMFEDIINEFGTNFEEFNYGDYFASEASADMFCMFYSEDKSKFFLLKIAHLFLYAGAKIFSSGKEYKTLTVGQLYDAIESGKWSDPD